MASRLMLSELTREEARAAAPEALVVFPIGATEQHGPHLPVGTDFFAVDHIAKAAASAAAARISVVVAPTLPFGSSAHHLPFGGTMSIATETYYRIVSDLVESLVIGGFRRVFLLNGHGGNHELAELVARDTALKHPVHVAAGSYWRIAWDALIAAQTHTQGRLAGHAGFFETSLSLALTPDLVRQPLPHREGAAGSDPRDNARPYRGEHHGSWQQMNGFTDSPDRATAEHGQRFLKAIIDAVAAALIEFYRSA
jgi:creatinine amidohydrolase